MSMLQMRLIAYGISVLLSLAVLGAAWWKIASHYEEIGEARVQKTLDKATNDFAQKVAAGHQAVAAMQAERDKARRNLAQLRAKGREDLEHAIETNPEWAVQPAMPAPVYDERVRDLAAIAARASAR